MARVDRALRRRLAEAIAPHGVTVSQYTALSVLQTRGTLSNAQLAERSFTTPQAANELVKSMEERGLIAREPHPSHGRILHISLTARGTALLAQCDAAADEVEEELLKLLRPEERGDLQRFLRACFSALTADL